MSGTLFIHKETSIYSQLDRFTSSVKFANKIVRKLSAHAHYRRNPRTWEYMERAAAEAFDEFAHSRIIEPDQMSGIDWKPISKVVLIWHDANGLGWAQIEARALRYVTPDTRVFVINGRRRVFELKKHRKRLLLRRLLEKVFAMDLLATVMFVTLTPILLAVDLFRGGK